MDSAQEVLTTARADLDAGRLDRAESFAEKVVSDAGAEPSHRAEGLLVLASCALRGGDAARAVGLARRALVDAPARTPVSVALMTLLADAHLAAGDRVAARDTLERARRDALEEGLPGRPLAELLERLATARLANEDLQGAAEALAERESLLAGASDTGARAACRLELARVRRTLGHLERAAALTRGALQDYALAPDPAGEVRARIELADIALQSRDLQTARTRIEDAVRGAVRIGDASLQQTAERRWVEFEIASGRGPAALAWLDHLAAASGSVSGSIAEAVEDDGPALPILDRLYAEAHLLAGDAVEAHARATRAVEAAAEIGDRVEVARSEGVLARTLPWMGRRIEGHAARQSARRTLEGLGIPTEGLQLDPAAESLGDGLGGARDESLLAGLLAEFRDEHDLSELLARALARVVELVEAERGAVLILGSDERPTEVVLDGLEWEGPGHPLPLSMGQVQEAIRREGPVVVLDTEGDAAERSLSITQLSIRSVISVPFRVDGEYRGVIYADTRSRHVLGMERHLSTLSGLARLVGTAVDNAHLERERIFQNRLMAYLVHELRTPLAVFAGATGLLKSSAEIDPEGIVEILGDMEAMIERMRRMIDDTLAVARASEMSEPPPAERLDLGRELERLSAGYRMIGASRGVEIESSVEEAIPILPTRRTRFEVALNNLVFNAVKYTGTGGTVQISARLRGDPGPREALGRPAAVRLFRGEPALRAAGTSAFVEVSVSNPGPPVSEGLAERLFDPFVRGDDVAGGVRSTGLGLAVVDACVRSLGGSVWLDRATPQPVTFRFTVPLQVEGEADPSTARPTMEMEAASEPTRTYKTLVAVRGGIPQERSEVG